ncbi:glycoside hydrolase family 13 protein [Allobranchiibius sp. GilTou38]|nr:glycoside hydrolase family 13 protein [Allobranchiibius sp. GilTou38]
MPLTLNKTQPWWRTAVIYQIYPRSWADADGNGVGDLPGIVRRLPYLRDLGIDAVWLSPFYTSPQADAGYDVADYYDVDPLFGDLSDADRLVTTAHELGLKLVVDLVPNHTSDEHAWFKAALTAAPGSPERGRYMFRDGRGADGAQPPNNWQSMFGGPAWQRVVEADGAPGQWYLHLFDRKQPDLNWDNPQVREEFEHVLRFWLDRGVDGFRVDVAHGLAKADGLPDWSGAMHMADGRQQQRAPMWDQPGVHEIYRSWRAVLDTYDVADADTRQGDGRMMCAEAWVVPAENLAKYVRPDEFHQAFNFEFLESPWGAMALRDVIDRTSDANAAVGAPTTWVLSNHDVVRHATRLGLPEGAEKLNGIGADDPQPDAELGLRRARAATALMLALPGGAYLYQGEELGLPDHTTMPDEARQDPTYARTRHKDKGRDGCRVPMPWEKDAPADGFNDTGELWLPQPAVYAELAVDQQVGVAGSTLEIYRTLLRLRREHDLATGELHWVTVEPDVLIFDNGAVRSITNFGSTPCPVPTGWSVAVASGPLQDGAVPVDTTVWTTRDA